MRTITLTKRHAAAAAANEKHTVVALCLHVAYQKHILKKAYTKTYYFSFHCWFFFLVQLRSKSIARTLSLLRDLSAINLSDADDVNVNSTVHWHRDAKLFMFFFFHSLAHSFWVLPCHWLLQKSRSPLLCVAELSQQRREQRRLHWKIRRSFDSSPNRNNNKSGRLNECSRGDRLRRRTYRKRMG